MRKVGAQDGRRRLPCLAAQGECHIARAATQVEDLRLRMGKDVSKGARRFSPPQPVDVEREDMVQQIVAWRDGGKHLAHGPCGRLLVGGTLWGGADDRGFYRLDQFD